MTLLKWCRGALQHIFALLACSLRIQKAHILGCSNSGLKTGRLRCRQEEDMCQDLDMIEEDGGRPQSLPANLLRSGCSASMDLDLDAQLLRLQKFFESHSLHEADVTGTDLPLLACNNCPVTRAD